MRGLRPRCPRCRPRTHADLRQLRVRAPPSQALRPMTMRKWGGGHSGRSSVSWVMALSARTRNVRLSRTDGAPYPSLKEEQMTHRISTRRLRVLLAFGVALLAASALPGRSGLPFGPGTAEAAYYGVPTCNDAGGVN